MPAYPHTYVGKRVRIHCSNGTLQEGVVIRYDVDCAEEHVVIGLLKQPVWLVNPSEHWHLV